MQNNTEILNDQSIRAALADGHIQCSAKDNDYNVYKFVNYGIRLEPLPAGQTERTLEVFATYASDETLRSVCKRLIEVGETYDKLLVRFYAHQPECTVCKTHMTESPSRREQWGRWLTSPN